MATTQNTFNGNGSNLGPFSFTFKWLESTDIKVTVGGVLKTAGTHYNLQGLNYTTKTGGQVLFTAGNAPPVGTNNIRIYRDTDDEVLSAAFSSGSAIRAKDLNDNFTQNLYVTQEINNNALNVDGSNAMVGPLNMNGFQIDNLAEPTTDSDAATKKYIDDRYGNLGIPGHTRWRKVATNGQTTFSGTGDYGGVLAYSSTREQVYINGALQQRGVDYAADNGTSVIFTVGLTVGDVVDIICVNNLTNSAVSNAGNITYSGQFTGQTARTVAAKLADVVSVKDFGAVGDGVADDTDEIQAAIDYCQENDKILELSAGAKYKISSTLNWKHGKSATDTKTYHVRLRGNGATFYPTGSSVAIKINPRCLLADKATGRGYADINIVDVVVDGFFSPTAASAISIGTTGYHCSCLGWGLVSDFLIRSFSLGTKVTSFVECRHIQFERLSIREGSCDIISPGAGSFCGDFVFDSCEFKGTYGSVPINLVASGTNAEVRGITFSACDIYGTGTQFRSTGTNTLVADIWFENGCQFDGPGSPAGEIALRIQGTNTGRIAGIHIIQTYFVNYTGAVIYANTASTSSVYQLNIQGGAINTITTSGGSGNAAIFCLDCEAVSIRDVEFDTVTATGGQLINIDGCTNVLIQNNKATRCTAPYAVAIGNASTNYIITNNMCNVTTAMVNDYSSGSPVKLVTNNLAI